MPPGAAVAAFFVLALSPLRVELTELPSTWMV
jgi:hypothetical protein